MEMFTLNALKLPKIAQNRHEWYFQNSLTLSFPKSTEFLILCHLFYSTPAHLSTKFFEYIPFRVFFLNNYSFEVRKMIKICNQNYSVYLLVVAYFWKGSYKFFENLFCGNSFENRVVVKTVEPCWLWPKILPLK